MSLAVIKTGGKQYLVKPGDKIKIEKLTGQVGDMVKFDTMLTTDETGQKIEIGKPFLKTQVTGKILKQARADKVIVIKFKSKVRYRRKVGHPQHYSQVQIESI